MTKELDADLKNYAGELNNAFMKLDIGRVGLLNHLGPGIITARDVVQAYRELVDRGGNLSEEDALGGLLGMYGVPISEAVEIGILWGCAYPEPELFPTQNFMAEPLDLKRRVRPQSPDFSPRRRLGVTEFVIRVKRRISPSI